MVAMRLAQIVRRRRCRLMVYVSRAVARHTRCSRQSHLLVRLTVASALEDALQRGKPASPTSQSPTAPVALARSRDGRRDTHVTKACRYYREEACL